MSILQEPELPLPPPRIALTGFARTGKDAVGKILIDQGYQRVALGDLIKDDLARDGAEPGHHLPFLDWARRRDERMVPSSIEIASALIYFLGSHPDPHTPDPHVKKRLRALYEGWGLWRYHDLLPRFMESLPPLPARIVNTRCMRLHEARLWRQAGGVIWAISRPMYAPETPMTRQEYDLLVRDGHIDRYIRNDGSLDDLSAAVRALLEGATHPNVSVGTRPSGTRL